MKNAFTLLGFILVLNLVSITLHAQAKKDTFYTKRYDKMIEIDVRGIFSGGGGSGVIFRKKHESGDFVFVDRTRFWRLGLYIVGVGFKRTYDKPNVQVYYSNVPYFSISPMIGHETMFHFGRFNLFYAFDINPYYSYGDYSTNSIAQHSIANTFGLSLSVSGGVRYYLSERFSLSMQSTPLSVSGYLEKIKYYSIYNPFNGSIEEGVVNSKELGFRVGQRWLSSLGFTYHF